MAVGKDFWLFPLFFGASSEGNKCEFISRPSITNGNSIPGANRKGNIDGTSNFSELTCYEKRKFPPEPRKTSVEAFLQP